jgi:cell division protein FtsI (penicillin-binding protein 3)
MRAGILVTLFVLSIFGGRLLQIQGLDAQELAKKAYKQRTAKKVVFAHRGDIVDASGAALATTVERRDIYVDQTVVGLPRLVGDRRVKGVAIAAADLAPLLGLPVETVLARLTGTSQGALLASQVTPDVARKIMLLMIPGMDYRQASRRVYPAGDLAANLLGFQAKNGVVWGGLEGKYDALLKGTDGSIRYEQGKDGAQIPTGVTEETDPVDGSTVQTTVLQDLQWKAQQLLAAKVASTKSSWGAITVTDVTTGKVLALATAPTFDPNNPGQANQSDTGDRALTDVFEPGSTAKVMTLAAALEEKATTPLSPIMVPPTLRRASHTFNDAETHGTEQLTTAGVLAKSSNIGTMLIGEQVPPSTMERYQRLFGLGATTGLGLPESKGILAPSATWNDTQRYTVLFGQGLSVNVLQASQVFATLANGGVRVQPTLVSGWTDADGRHFGAPAPTRTRVVSAQTARSMIDMMEGVVVEGGTAVKAAIPGYRVAGKTGTAQRADPACGCYRGYTASFIGMAPADHPELVIAVVLQNPVNGHFGGEIAAPVFQELMSYALKLRKVPPSGSPSPDIPTTW